MNHETLNLGIISIPIYSICILIGVIAAAIIIFKEGLKNKVPSFFTSNLFFWTIITGIIGARLYYVLFNLDYYKTEPLEIFQIYKGGLAIHGGLLFGIITFIIYCKKYSVNILKMLDICIPGVIFAQAIGRWGNFFNGECYGLEVTKSYLVSNNIPDFIVKGMKISGTYYEPLFFYESLLCILGFIILMILRKIKIIKTGFITSFYLIWYGIIRLVIESHRQDSLMLGNIKVAQIVSILMIIGGVLLFVFSIIKSKKYKDDKISEKEIKI